MMHVQKINEMLRDFGIGSGGWTEIVGGTANKNYKIKAKHGVYVLRQRNRKYSSEEWARLEEEYLLHLAKRNIPAPLPVPLPQAEGRSWLQVDETVYQLYTYIDGESYDPRNERHLEETGAFLGRLHRAVGDFVPTAKKTLPRYDNPGNIVHAVQSILNNPNYTVTAEQKRILGVILRAAERIQSELPDPAYHQLHKCWIHGDFHPGNVKFNQDRICGIFDFDWISVQPRMRDIADGIAYFAATRETMIDSSDIFSLTQTCSFDPDRIRLFMKGYRETCGRPLDGKEIAAIPLLIQARLMHSRVEALAKIPATRTVEMLTKGIEAPLTWLDEHGDELIRIMN
jgi:Ser/Thr protein kinase RdoA (MazF antagonist)